MSKTKLLLDVVEDVRSLADSLQTLADLQVCRIVVPQCRGVVSIGTVQVSASKLKFLSPAQIQQIKISIFKYCL